MSKAKKVEQASAAQEITAILEQARVGLREQIGATQALLIVARRFTGADEFLTACREPEKQYKERADEPLPQPYLNAKSIIKYAFHAGLTLAEGARAKSYNELRREVTEHRAARRQDNRPVERKAFDEALAQVLKADNPLLLGTAARMLEKLTRDFAAMMPTLEATAEAFGVTPQKERRRAH